MGQFVAKAAPRNDPLIEALTTPLPCFQGGVANYANLAMMIHAMLLAQSVG
jgi:hypothetical protein